uniref:RNA polymerase beta'' subunit n=1 Tax=Choristocarpus tenellus TaxID=116065 RepID=UPI002E78FEEE|nr:RNA polymerase beta'' subunit [Choristocarpus tenellus]WAM62347.1 RNA polymerase beta'' subunit [Choristocarpus tenellus]
MIKTSKIFYNYTINKKRIKKKIIEWIFKTYGQNKATYFVDQLKELGFEYATKSGLSISLEDLKVPPIKKQLVNKALIDVENTELDVNKGKITEIERFQKIINIWNNTSEELKERVITYFKQTDPLNSVYIMAFSGARGNISQVRQLVGMRGLMADSNGQIIETPIKANFREGLSITDYIISSYGARKGLVDTAIKTADSGYLTRRLVEIAQRIVINEIDCKTKRGLKIKELKDETETILSFKERIMGRLLAVSVFDPKTKSIIAERNKQITSNLIKNFIKLKIKSVVIRSPLTCQCRRSICQKCYGLNLSSNNIVQLGEAVGIIAAQSIGEPGTQLTMRTFHTGGIFTGQIVRKVRSQYSGYVHFDSKLQIKLVRTNDGQNAFKSENKSVINIITYDNSIKKISIPPDTVLLIANNSYIKKSDVLFELPPKIKQIQDLKKEIKYVLSKSTGEILFTKNDLNLKNIQENRKSNGILWILSGQIYNLPLFTKLNINPFTKIYKNQSIAKSVFYTTLGGFVHFIKNPKTNQIRAFKISNSFKTFSHTKIFIQKQNSNINKCIIFLSKSQTISLKLEQIEKNKFLLGNLENRNYQTQTGGIFYTTDYQKNAIYLKYDRRLDSTVFYIPEMTIQKDLKQKDLKFKNEKYVKKNKEIFANYFINLSGYITVEKKESLKEIIIKPGLKYFINYNKIKNFFDLNIREFHQQVFFPGECLFEKFLINTLSYIELIKIPEKGLILFIRPIVRYEIIKKNLIIFLQKNYFHNLNFKIEPFSKNFTSGLPIKSDTSIQFIKYPIILNHSNSNIIFTFNKPTQKKSFCSATIKLSQIILMETLIPKEIKKTDTFLNFLIEQKQFIEPYTVLVSLDVLTSLNSNLYLIKEKKTIEKHTILITSQHDYETIYLENFNYSLNQNRFMNFNQKLGNNLIVKKSGLIEKVEGNKLTIRLGLPYLFTKDGILKKNLNDFVCKQDILGEFNYERLKTGDIVQGLPRVEELLEARNTKNEAILATKPGIVTNIKYGVIEKKILINRIIMHQMIEKDFEIHNIDKDAQILIKKFQFINICQPLTKGSLNPQKILNIYFRYYSTLGILNIYQSSYFSFKRIQTFLLSTIQAVYCSQGVNISDKHIEIIIREMTNKVAIDYPGKTDFLPGDLIDLEQAYYINTCLKEKNKITYRPILLGITKSALKTNGFLAAASFQETTRVLTKAAVEGKDDWLRGLKENVITGRLIPSGTGFFENKDLSYKNKLLFNSNIEKKIYKTI